MKRPGNSEPVPVLLMSRDLGPGGSERQLASTALGLDPARFQAHAGCFRSGFRAEELRLRGIPVLELAVRSFLRPGAISGAWALGQYIRSHGIRVVHSFDYPMNCFAVPVARMTGVPAVLSSQRSYRELCPPSYRPLLRLSDRMADGVVVNCEAMREHLIDDEGVARDRVHLCYNGIDTDVFQPRGRGRVEVLRDAEIVIGTVGVLRPEKGLVTLVEAFARLKPARQRMKLAIVGSGPLREELDAMARRFGIRDSCVFEPATRDVAPWLRSIDIFVLPSLSEALSNSLMEAMACGCAPIASRVGGNPELVRDGVTGFTFNAGDEADLAAKIQLLANDDGTRAGVAARAAGWILERFSLEALAEHMQEIYDTLLNRSRVR